ncbi:hypothetical protein K7X08_004152 [Anisodus acutangulus]|uniref:Uncharacterized protein n=1 Tax=Anisodus acutangulus TaxID=402998 RepID=A0A9Q1MKK2_9SOLA|nr:hypothetical protein K7X08_004152 [Anisodus acutangulus]
MTAGLRTKETKGTGFCGGIGLWRGASGFGTGTGIWSGMFGIGTGIGCHGIEVEWRVPHVLKDVEECRSYRRSKGVENIVEPHVVHIVINC